MDPVSQGALGATAAALGAKKDEVRLAALVGWIGGMLADADVFIRSSEDPLLQIEYHRHFTHSLLFIPVGGLIAAGLLFPFLRKRISFARLYLYSLFGYATSGLLDACTSYGTQLLWPFSDMRVAWNIISIIDPIYTGALLLGLGLACFRKRRKWVVVSAAFSIAYLLVGVAQNHRATRLLEELAESRGHQEIEKLTVKPSFANLLLWRGIYSYDGRFYIDAIRVPFWGEGRVYEGVDTERVAVEPLLQGLSETSALAHDLRRFDHFSDGYLVWHPERPEVLGDARYAMVPDSDLPLWGIAIDRSGPNQHAPFLNFRDRDAEALARFGDMLVGREVE
ncbi:metal-dependent hydrolase [Pelagicoccus sp. SDUM812003]|uniref:metal-dependent hydrolase n=1 Tax=Pelagicoccus sp. SDUM812003 TaxID=3041267 RepID=UPI00280F8BC6|nr:metal-dependent hydrolase [Pelagicoccus sp. SDUM812003]MDQ8204173.1 metal-dependent hydrolase [Pelagicoccus sp. SDUM812003]